MNATESSTGPSPTIRRGRVDSVTLYEITEAELDLMEKGSPNSLYLNFAIFLLSIAFTAIASLVTCTFKYPVAQTVFIVAAVVALLIGVFLLLLWSRTRTSVTSIVNKIKKRIQQ